MRDRVYAPNPSRYCSQQTGEWRWHLASTLLSIHILFLDVLRNCRTRHLPQRLPCAGRHANRSGRNGLMHAIQ